MESKYRILSYTTDGSEHGGKPSPTIGNSLHIALSSDGGRSYKAVNDGIGLLFQKADYEENPKVGVNKSMTEPYLFRAGNKWGVIAVRRNEVCETDRTDGCVEVFLTEDLKKYEFMGYIRVSEERVQRPSCDYDGEKAAISYSAADGKRYRVFFDGSELVSLSEECEDNYRVPECREKGFTPVNAVDITKEEYERFDSELNLIYNTGVRVPEEIKLSPGASLDNSLPQSLTYLYSDGSEHDYPVKWELDGINTSVAGEYEIRGTADIPEYRTRFIFDICDPSVCRYNGRLFFGSTWIMPKMSSCHITVGETIRELILGTEHIIFNKADGMFWSPELHDVDGRLILLLSYGRSLPEMASYVLELEGADPKAASDWSEPRRIVRKNGEKLRTDGITLSMTYFKHGGRFYYAWAGRYMKNSDTSDWGSSDIYIAEFDPRESVSRLKSEPVRLKRPEYGWMRSFAQVLDTPYVVERNGELYMALSANLIDMNYCSVLMKLQRDGDPLDPEAWEIEGYPSLSARNIGMAGGPGHVSFFKDCEDRDCMTYHLQDKNGRRTVCWRPLHFDINGRPELKLTEYVNDRFKTVSVKLVIN